MMGWNYIVLEIRRVRIWAVVVSVLPTLNDKLLYTFYLKPTTYVFV